MKALIIGINYSGTRYELKGCINDVARVRDMLYQVYGVTSVVTMTDQLPPSNALYPSRENILAQFLKLIETIQPGETGYIHFSGHGLVRFPGNDATDDGGGCMIVPADAIVSRRSVARTPMNPKGKSRRAPSRTVSPVVGSGGEEGEPSPVVPGAATTDLAGTPSPARVGERSTAMMGGRPEIRRDRMIRNDELWEIFRRLRKDASVFIMVDACHSGKIIELPYLMVLNATDSGTSCSLQRSEDRKPEGGSVILLSACEESEESADTHIEGRPTGALTYAFCETIKNQPEITYLALVKAVRAFMDANLPPNFRQVPQLSFSHMTDCTRNFNIAAPGLSTPRGFGPLSSLSPFGKTPALSARSTVSPATSALGYGLVIPGSTRRRGVLLDESATSETLARLSPVDRRTGRPLVFDAYPTFGG